jgi:hypothetical protein
MSRTHKLTEDKDTPNRAAIRFIGMPCSRRSLFASSRSIGLGCAPIVATLRIEHTFVY